MYQGAMIFEVEKERGKYIRCLPTIKWKFLIQLYIGIQCSNKNEVDIATKVGDDESWELRNIAEV